MEPKSKLGLKLKKAGAGAEAEAEAAVEAGVDTGAGFLNKPNSFHL